MLDGVIAKNDVYADPVEPKKIPVSKKNKCTFTVYFDCTKGKTAIIQNLNATKGDDIVSARF